ncbi:hypothetical protein N7474_003123 [Penicillium riverlandense]|uniref:uncharacterized protein n=1 Tax=Penicillium riverlandense TaxID=1903569 RepID=UPI002549218F|nr:uncharacterized protein N7474_003123 [Penicillium riverlandense]KAJ5825985.1 hypothetical protein N7474_003123 [Penicillium riverlandense]
MASKPNYFINIPPVPKTERQPPDYPPRPDLYGKVAFGPYISADDARLACRAWFKQDRCLGKAWKCHKNRGFPIQLPDIIPQDHDPRVINGLATNVYEHLMSDPLFPVTRWEEDNPVDQTLRLSELFKEIRDKVAIRDENVRNSKYWTNPVLNAELRKRGLPVAKPMKEKLSAKDARKENQNCLINDELARCYSFQSQSDLSHWGIDRPEKYKVNPATDTDLTPLDMYTFAIHLSPYNPTYWLSRAYCHYQQKFFDLAIGDAYRAQLLCEVVMDDLARNRQLGLYSRIWHAVEQHFIAIAQYGFDWKPDIMTYMRKNGITNFIPTVQKAAIHITSLSLASLNCWDDVDAQHRLFRSTFSSSESDRDQRVVEERRRLIKPSAEAWQNEKAKQNIFLFERRYGSVKGTRKYPYEEEIDRVDSKFLDMLTRCFFEAPPRTPKPPTWNCEVKQVPGNQGIGVFATEIINPGEIIFCEEPTIRGHLHTREINGDKTQSFIESGPGCETCLKTVDEPIKAQYQTRNILDGTHEFYCNCIVGRPTRGDGKGSLWWCTGEYPADRPPREKACLEIARELFHFGSCGEDWLWLHDAMRPMVKVHKEPKTVEPPPGSKEPVTVKDEDVDDILQVNEIHGTILSLLLKNVFEITLHRRQQGTDPHLLPHEIDELLVLDGWSENNDYWTGSNFPFNFAANIQVPFDILSKLGVDIFRDFSFDTWVIQIVLRKLLTNVVPWDGQWRGRTESIRPVDQDKPLKEFSEQQAMKQTQKSFTRWDPSFSNLYLFPGFSMFNHCCGIKQVGDPAKYNADWAYDNVVPNRVVVWAQKPIKPGEEIRLRYRHSAIRPDSPSAIHLFGGPCKCEQCACAGDARDIGGFRGAVATGKDPTPTREKQATEGQSKEGRGTFRKRNCECDRHADNSENTENAGTNTKEENQLESLKRKMTQAFLMVEHEEENEATRTLREGKVRKLAGEIVFSDYPF